MKTERKNPLNRQNAKNHHKQLNQSTPQIAFFSDSALVVLISVITLLLQLISFATTWNGSKIYLEGVFSHASLLFAIAIQATAYFFSNSLRGKLRPLKVIALCAALCCSTYFSYIGIYNSVNSPITYLQENYVRLSHEMTRTYEENIEKKIASARKAVGQASALITAEYTSLQSAGQQYADCRNALKDITVTYSSDLRPPRQSSYENYEDYAAAYRAYVNSISQGSSTENTVNRESVLSSYGFASIEELNRLAAENEAALRALETALGVAVFDRTAADFETDTVLNEISALTETLTLSINAAANGDPLDAEAVLSCNRLFQAASLCGYNNTSPAELITTLRLLSDTTSTGFLQDYSALVAALPKGHVTDADMMNLKSAMDSELLSGIIKLNALLPEGSQIAFDDSRYQITDLYLIPVAALRTQDTRTTAFFCLTVASLIDILSVLFAVSLREKKPLWKKHTLLFGSMEDYAPYIYASLPLDAEMPALSSASSCQPDSEAALVRFVDCFHPSPRTEGDGYMMQADMDTLQEYGRLTALLCQLNLAKIIPAGFLDNPSDVLLLKARFVLWVNTNLECEESV